ncbi:MAG: SDR family NAD(P)-dependent oxidoreductase [Candidatus Altimarinota bacterium]
MKFKGKTALITGASRGIGYALSKKLVEEGMRVYSISRTRPVKPVKGVEYLLADVTRENQIQKAVAKISGQVDLLVNNAGVMRRGNYEEIEVEDFDLVWSVNVKGSWLMFKNLGEKLAEGAVTLQTNSKNSLSVKADAFPYTLSKMANVHLDELIAKNRPDLDMRVVYLGRVDTVLEWTGYNAKQKADRIKMAMTADSAAELMLGLLKSDMKNLVYRDVDSYEMV